MDGPGRGRGGSGGGRASGLSLATRSRVNGVVGYFGGRERSLASATCSAWYSSIRSLDTSLVQLLYSASHPVHSTKNSRRLPCLRTLMMRSTSQNPSSRRPSLRPPHCVTSCSARSAALDSRTRIALCDFLNFRSCLWLNRWKRTVTLVRAPRPVLSITLALYQMPGSSLASTRAPISTSAGSRRVPGGGTIGPKAGRATVVCRVQGSTSGVQEGA